MIRVKSNRLFPPTVYFLPGFEDRKKLKFVQARISNPGTKDANLNSYFFME
jgi:hypothetical protein